MQSVTSLFIFGPQRPGTQELPVLITNFTLFVCLAAFEHTSVFLKKWDMVNVFLAVCKSFHSDPVHSIPSSLSSASCMSVKLPVCKTRLLILSNSRFLHRILMFTFSSGLCGYALIRECLQVNIFLQ